MTSEIITSQNEFEDMIGALAGSQWLAIDTEFIRESSYYPKLCLIQIATENLCTCIDVLALSDTTHLIEILKNPDCIKIFHSARQDLEVIYAEYGFIPQPIFDSQIAASMLGPDEQISYAEIVSQHLSVNLSKTQSRTDWSRRPLSDAQIAYALDDVRYLGPLYTKLSVQLTEKDRILWLQEECEQLTALANYDIDPNNVWKNVRGAGKAQGLTLQRIQQLASWREIQAQDRNRPRQWILKDRAIVELANMNTPSSESIAHYLQNEYPKSLRHKEKIAALLQQPINNEALNHLSSTIDRRLSKPQQTMAKNMMNFIKQQAAEIGAAPSLLANRKSIEKLVQGRKSKVMSGWRKDVVGNELQKMLATESS